jgi:hypothetical protein
VRLALHQVQRAQRVPDAAGQRGRFRAVAAHVTQQEQQGAVGSRMHVVEVAADAQRACRGPVVRGQPGAGHSRQFRWMKRGFEAFERRTLLAVQTGRRERRASAVGELTDHVPFGLGQRLAARQDQHARGLRLTVRDQRDHGHLGEPAERLAQRAGKLTNLADRDHPDRGLGREHGSGQHRSDRRGEAAHLAVARLAVQDVAPPLPPATRRGQHHDRALTKHRAREFGHGRGRGAQVKAAAEPSADLGEEGSVTLLGNGWTCRCRCIGHPAPR